MQTNSKILSNPDEKGFTLIRTDIIQLWVWLEGSTPLDDQPLKSLSEDISYRIRETLDSAVNYMRHCKRSKLKTSDLNKAFQICNIEKTYGYLNQQPFEYNIIKGTENKEKILQNCYKTYLYELKDKKIQLKLPDDEDNELNQEKSSFKCDDSKVIYAKWWIVNNSFRPDPNESNSGKNDLDEQINSDQDVENEFIITPLNDEYKTFYETITSIVLMQYESQENDEEMFETILNTLRTNLKLQPILSHLISFISQTIQKLTSNCTTRTTKTNLVYLQRCIDVLKHLIMNSNVFLAPKGFFSKIISCLLFCILQNLKIVSTEDGLGFRENCSSILVLFMRLYQRFSIDTINYITNHFFLPRLNEKIKTDSQLFSIYGVLCILKNFGGQKCLITYYNWLVKKHTLNRQDPEYSIEKINSIYEQVYDLFGDSFINQLRIKNRTQKLETTKFQESTQTNTKRSIFRTLAYLSDKKEIKPDDIFENYQKNVSKIKKITLNYGKQIKIEPNTKLDETNFNFCNQLFTNSILIRKHAK